MLAEAHARGVRVVVDWVPNHSSDQHPWFVESRSGRDSPKRDWYVWRDPAPGGGPPNNWRSAFVDRAWTLDEASGQYYLHSFLPQQPELNWDNPEVEAAMHDVLRFWLDRGVDGFRIDVVHKLGKDPELGDNEPGRPHEQDWPSVHERVRRIRAVVDEYEDRMIVGEVYLRDLERLVQYVKSGDELNLAHNFVFVLLPWDAREMRRSVDEFERLSEGAAWPTWFLANHDHSRVATRYAGSDPGSGERRSRLATLMTCTLRGTPFLFEGEELGLPDAEVPPQRIVDVGGRDPERAPIPWERPSRVGPGAGFTSADPWLPLVADAEHLCVEAQEEDAGSTLHFVRALLRARAGSEVLQAGSQRSLDAGRDVFAYVRELGDERVVVALNFKSRRVKAALPSGLANVLISTRPGRELGELDAGSLVLEPDEGVVLRLLG